jgi:hypothetical protein
MTENSTAGTGKRFAIGLTGFNPGVSPEDLIPALQRLFPGKTPEQIRSALAGLPLLLTRSATEEQARKVKPFLESKGAVLKITLASPAPEPVPKAVAAEGPAGTGVPREAVRPPEEEAPSGADRRRKPRVHPGIEVHPMGIGEILDRSFRILRQYFWLFFFVVLIPQGLFFVLKKGVALLLSGTGFQDVSMAMGIGFGISAFIAGIFFIVLQFWAQGALIHAVSETYLGHRSSVKGSYGAIWPQLGRLLGTLILVGIVIVVAPALAGILMAILIPIFVKLGVSKVIIALVVVLVVILTLWAFFSLFMNLLMVDKVVVLEGMAWRKAMRRSKELMKARTEPGFLNGPKMKAGLILLLGFLIAMAIHLILQIPGAILSAFMPGNLVVQTIQEILGLAANALATVYAATAMILYYYDIRVRKEGFDLKMMAENL